MPTSAIGNKAQEGFRSLRRSAQMGFTLIELMVVITIIGVMAAAVILVFPDPRGSLEGEAERFAARVLAVRDEAVIGSRETVLIVATTGYRFERRARGQLLPLTEKPFAPQIWTAGTAAAVARETRVTFDPTGLASAPLSLRLVRGGAQVVIDIAADGTINVGA
jgi:general secretion pathway protein H